MEGVWDHAKYGDLADFVPEDLVDLELEPTVSMKQARAHPRLLHSSFHATKLELQIAALAMQGPMETDANPTGAD